MEGREVCALAKKVYQRKKNVLGIPVMSDATLLTRLQTKDIKNKHTFKRLPGLPFKCVPWAHAIFVAVLLSSKKRVTQTNAHATRFTSKFELLQK